MTPMDKETRLLERSRKMERLYAALDKVDHLLLSKKIRTANKNLNRKKRLVKRFVTRYGTGYLSARRSGYTMLRLLHLWETKEETQEVPPLRIVTAWELNSCVFKKPKSAK